ncbi:MAG TPA: hypothetical protein VMV89_09950 [Candidatus Paceibacterota bacterium]|nr:hypothetical protein [Candidatus Paceibacterota bacterium]
MKRLVADTGPILHLHEAGALHLFPLIGEIFLPPLVAAESLNLETHGSIGVVLWAAAKKLVKKPDARLLLEGLEKSSLWMSPKVRVEARSALEKLFTPSTPQ